MRTVAILTVCGRHLRQLLGVAERRLHAAKATCQAPAALQERGLLPRPATWLCCILKWPPSEGGQIGKTVSKLARNSVGSAFSERACQTIDKTNSQPISSKFSLHKNSKNPKDALFLTALGHVPKRSPWGRDPTGYSLNVLLDPFELRVSLGARVQPVFSGHPCGPILDPLRGDLPTEMQQSHVLPPARLLS